MKRFGLLVVVALSGLGYGQEVATRAQLEAILSDQIILEDFEGVSLAGGTSITAPSPLNAASQPTWHLEPGITYTTSGGTFRLYSSPTNNLQSPIGDWVATFDRPQVAVGFDLVNWTGNLTFNDTVTFYSGANVLGTLQRVFPAGTRFAGWQNATGITSVRVTSSVGIPEVDDIAWGRNAVPEPGSAFALALGSLIASRKMKGATPKGDA